MDGMREREGMVGGAWWVGRDGRGMVGGKNERERQGTYEQ